MSKCHTKASPIQVGNHAISRFRERSQWPRVQNLTANQVRGIIRDLVRNGESVDVAAYLREYPKVRRVVKASFRTRSGALNSIYLLLLDSQYDHAEEEVVTVYTEEFHQNVLLRNG